MFGFLRAKRFFQLEDSSRFDRIEEKRRRRKSGHINQHAAVHRNRAVVTESVRLRFEWHKMVFTFVVESLKKRIPDVALNLWESCSKWMGRTRWIKQERDAISVTRSVSCVCAFTLGFLFHSIAIK